MAAIPVIDISSTGVGEIGESIKKLGFLALKSPGTPSSSQVDGLFDTIQNFFVNESVAEKERCGITVENKGWIRKRQESLDVDGYPGGDNKEAFNIAMFNSDNEPSQPLPPLLSKHVNEISQFTKSCHTLAMKLLEVFALDMGLEKDFFTSRHSFDNKDSTILRFLYYPPAEDTPAVAPEAKAPAKDIRAGAHSDYGTLTLLFQKDVGGLQILVPKSDPTEADTWIDAPVIPETVLVNLGDAFDFWTGGRFPSTQHRVVAPRSADEKVARFSIVYFLHPSDDELLERIPQSVNSQEDERSVIRRFGINSSEKLTAKEWLMRRLNPTYSDRKETS